MPETAKVLIAEHVVPIEDEILSPGAVAIRDGIIVDIGDPHILKNNFLGAQIEEYPGGTLLPGLVNAHADLSLSAYSGPELHSLPRPEGSLPLLMPWLVTLSRYKAAMGLDEQQRAVTKGLRLSLKSGVTTLGDQCRYPVAVPLYEKSGLRTLVLSEIENIQRPAAQDEFEQALALADEVVYGKNPRITAGLAPFSAYTLSKNLLRILAHHAIQMEIPIHLHAALSFSEMEFFYDSLGEISAILFREAGWTDKIPPPHKMTPVQYLHEIGFLKAHPALVGCLHLGPTDTALLAHHDCIRVYAPRAFDYLQVGTVDWAEVISKGISWALGTMSIPSGASLNLWDELRAIWYAGEWKDRDKFAAALLRAATLGGAQALRMEKAIGSIVKGKQADLIVVDSPEVEDSLYAALLDQTREENLKASWVAGEKVFPELKI